MGRDEAEENREVIFLLCGRGYIETVDTTQTTWMIAQTVNEIYTYYNPSLPQNKHCLVRLRPSNITAQKRTLLTIQLKKAARISEPLALPNLAPSPHANANDDSNDYSQAQNGMGREATAQLEEKLAYSGASRLRADLGRRGDDLGEGLEDGGARGYDRVAGDCVVPVTAVL